MGIYTKRICEECGAEFFPGYAGQVACSLTCKKKREKSQKKVRIKRYRQKQRELKRDYVTALEKIVELEAKIEVYEKNANFDPAKWQEFEKNNEALAARLTEANEKNRIMKDELDRAQKQLREYERELDALRKQKPADPNALENVVPDASKIKECKRMNLRALHLPCGEREECWGGTPCEKTAGIVKEEKMEKKKPDFVNFRLPDTDYEWVKEI